MSWFFLNIFLLAIYQARGGFGVFKLNSYFEGSLRKTAILKSAHEIGNLDT